MSEKLIKHVQAVPAVYGKYHLPLVLQDKQFNADCTLFYPAECISATHPIWVPEFFGDTPVINGKAYPYLDAQPRRYRLRVLNGYHFVEPSTDYIKAGTTETWHWINLTSGIPL
jgi:FtsP/CotA-like multicopper oxidase with cupredoxin domain